LGPLTEYGYKKLTYYFIQPINLSIYKIYSVQIPGGMNMRGKYKSYLLPVVIVFFLALSAESLFIGSDTITQNASALKREFEENITVESNGFKVLDLSFSAGEELELIFFFEVEQGLPIDVWFVNYANYVRLVDGNEFLFFIDGSQQEVTKATKIVSVTQHDAYALVFANYNNDTVDVYLSYDITVYPEEEDKGDEIPLWKEYYVMLPLGLVIGLLVGFLVFRVIGGSKKSKPKKGKKKPSKSKKKVPSKPKKKVKTRAKKVSAVETEDVEPEEEVESEEEVTKETSEAKSEESTQFCGNCGSPVTTKFCPNCGEEAGKA
jgi:hypothetical protein